MKEKAVTFSFDNSKCLKKDNYMIILNDKKSNNFFSEILKKYNNILNLPYMECPFCHSTNFIKWGFYTRSVCYINNHTLQYKLITIKRVRCNHCKHTHALLPSFIIPYKRNLLDVILYSFTDNDISLDIPFDTLIKWHKQFHLFLPFLKTKFQCRTTFSVIEQLIQNISFSYLLFFQSFHKILMMVGDGIVGMAYF